MNFYNVTIPDGIKEVFEEIQLSDTGIIIVQYKKPQILRQLVVNGANMLTGGPVSVGHSVQFHTEHNRPLTREESKNIDAMIAMAKGQR